MIKTTELMLGNLIEHDGKYHVVESIGKAHIQVSVGSISSDYINPIPLTEGVQKRLGYGGLLVSTVHGFQNWHTINGGGTVDITPLLSPRYTTHDGVEVWEGDGTWACYKNGIEKFSGEKDKPTLVHDIHKKNESTHENVLFFSTQQACQSYIDSVTRKPIFTTEDGVDVFEGDKYWYCGRKGVVGVSELVVDSSYEKFPNLIEFSTKELAEKYTNSKRLKSQADEAEKEYQDLLNANRK